MLRWKRWMESMGIATLAVGVLSARAMEFSGAGATSSYPIYAK